MKKKSIISLIGSASLVSTMVACAAIGISHFNQKLSPAVAYDASKLPTTIDLNDSSESDIRAYYSSLNDLSESERQGKNLLKNLKPILKKDQKYYGYDSSMGDNIWKMYEITDRDWKKSPASEITGYNASTNTITGYSYGSSASNSGSNPYLHALYVDRTVDNKMHAWKREGTDDSSHGNNAEWSIDREHIWAKSQGFEATGKGGARGDPMHLWSGDSDVNSSLHNDQMYGYVDANDSKSKPGKWSYGKNNYVGTSITLGTSKSTEKVFEPQDSDKGDIARAIFYMVARYNNLSGSDSDGINADNPNLELVQSNEVLTAYTSSTSVTGKMGILTDLLSWHHLDPVDEFEVHRNNLLYKNYTNNRNPFIDFPDWVDYIWGTATYNGKQLQNYSDTPTGSANPTTDQISKSTNTPVAPTDNKGNNNFFKQYWWVIVIAAVVVVVIIILIAVGAVRVKVTKKGKVKLKANTPSKKTSSKKTSSNSKKKK